MVKRVSYDEWAASLSERGSDILGEMISDSEGCGRCGGDGSVYGRGDVWHDCPKCHGTGQEPRDYEGIRESVERRLAEEAEREGRL